MTVRDLTRFCSLALAFVLVMVACKKPPVPPPPPPPPPPVVSGPPAAEEKAEPVTLTLVAAADVNPNASGRPSPVVVRVYQLKSETKFGVADLLELYDEGQKILGEDLNGPYVEMTVRPGETATVPNFFVDPYTRFIGVIAAYRDYRNANAQWKVVVPRAVPVKKTMTVSVGQLRVELTAK